MIRIILFSSFEPKRSCFFIIWFFLHGYFTVRLESKRRFFDPIKKRVGPINVMARLEFDDANLGYGSL